MEEEILSPQTLKKEIRRDSNINAILLFGFWAIYFIISFFMSPAVKQFIPDTDSALFKNTATLVFYVLLYPIGFPLLFLLFRILSRKHKDMKILKCFRKPQMPAFWTIRWIIITIGATYGAALLSNLIFTLIEEFTGVNLTEADMSTDTSALGIFTTIIAAPVFAPVFEELFFRGTLFRNVRHHGSWSMIIVCGITFGLWHANYPQFLFAATMGIFSCYLYEKTKSIIPSMTVHFLINSVGAFMTILRGQIGLQTVDDVKNMTDLSVFDGHPIAFMLMMLTGLGLLAFLATWVVLVILEIVLFRKQCGVEKKKTEMSEGAKFLAYISAPAMALVMAGMLALTVYRALGGEF